MIEMSVIAHKPNEASPIVFENVSYILHVNSQMSQPWIQECHGAYFWNVVETKGKAKAVEDISNE